MDKRRKDDALRLLSVFRHRHIRRLFILWLAVALCALLLLVVVYLLPDATNLFSTLCELYITKIIPPMVGVLILLLLLDYTIPQSRDVVTREEFQTVIRQYEDRLQTLQSSPSPLSVPSAGAEPISLHQLVSYANDFRNLGATDDELKAIRSYLHFVADSQHTTDAQLRQDIWNLTQRKAPPGGISIYGGNNQIAPNATKTELRVKG